MQFAVYLADGSVPQGYTDWFAQWVVGQRPNRPSPAGAVPIEKLQSFLNVPPGPGSIEVILFVLDRPTGQASFDSGWLRSGLVRPQDGSLWEFDATSGQFREAATLGSPGIPRVTPGIPKVSTPSQARGLNVQYAKVQVKSG